MREHCPSYCGLSCVDGSCPYADCRSLSSNDCAECWCYEGCSDCCFAVDDGSCAAFEERSLYEENRH